MSHQTDAASAEGPLSAHEFRVFSETAERIDLCLFDQNGVHETRRIPLVRRADGEWIAHAPGLSAGQLYGLRAHGPWDPRRGLRFNPAKLLLDPRARAVAGCIRWDDAVCDARRLPNAEPTTRDDRDSSLFVPRSVLVDDAFNWCDDRAPRTPWSDTLLYECHVKGTTMLHPDVPPRDRGRYLGLCAPPILDHLCALGVTAVELLPVQHALTRRWLIEKGLTNYWGYDPIGFFAPDARFASSDRGQQVVEFKQMVQAFHARGIEVILDVVFNHTVEGDETGPTLCLRGLDHATSYRLDAEGRCINVTGCGNTLNTNHSATRRLVLDALRYWVERMHVDGFRLDLASALARGEHGFDPDHPLIAEMAADSVLSGVKLIAEPWDAQADGYALGRFPRGWPEWNDRFRDTVRRFWRGDAGQAAGMAYALTGSSDVFAAKGSALSGMNYVACHDGFTVQDLTTYENRRNHNNGEEGRDGQQDNASCNWGVEGPTRDRRIIRLRDRARRNMLATVALAQGVPMLRAGDELGQSQQGNNNAYCQDNQTSWLHWPCVTAGIHPPPPREGAETLFQNPPVRSETLAPSRSRLGCATESAGGSQCQSDSEAVSSQEGSSAESGWNAEAPSLLAYARQLFALRRNYPLLRGASFLTGQCHCECGIKDVTWLRPDGRELTPADWHDPALRALGMLRHEHISSSSHARTLLLLLNANARAVRFQLPSLALARTWTQLISSVGRSDRKGAIPGVLRLRAFSTNLLASAPDDS
ncbi:MAG: glycogen debranching protein GlgX [Phycisphaerales bacterium]|nr:glycogen debranching protein GlgX [Phycisphaerales bacterium]